MKEDNFPSYIIFLDETNTTDLHLAQEKERNPCIFLFWNNVSLWEAGDNAISVGKDSPNPQSFPLLFKADLSNGIAYHRTEIYVEADHEGDCDLAESLTHFLIFLNFYHPETEGGGAGW